MHYFSLRCRACPQSLLFVLSHCITLQQVSRHNTWFPSTSGTVFAVRYKDTRKWRDELGIQLLTSFRDAGLKVYQARLFVQTHLGPGRQTNVFQGHHQDSVCLGAEAALQLRCHLTWEIRVLHYGMNVWQQWSGKHQWELAVGITQPVSSRHFKVYEKEKLRFAVPWKYSKIFMPQQKDGGGCFLTSLGEEKKPLISLLQSGCPEME